MATVSIQKFEQARLNKMAGLHNAVLKEIIKRKLTFAEIYLTLEILQKNVIEEFDKKLKRDE